LYGVACRLDLGRYLELGRSEEMSGGRGKKTLLVDALEALIAAIYLDGGIEPVRAFVTAHVLDAPCAADPAWIPKCRRRSRNFKSACRNWRSPANCRSRATPLCGSAARSIPRPSP
jgi:hypothetical protein